MQETKRLLRGELAEQWKAYMVPEAEHAWAMLNSPQTVAALGKVMERLSGKKPSGGEQQQRSKM